VSVLETVGIFVGIPLLIIAVIGGPAYVSGGRAQSKRYRPGRPFTFTPVWFLSAPERLHPDGARALTAGEQRPALAAGEPSQGAASQETARQGVATPLGATGGASDRW
jgi:hypothetical protein